MKNLIAGNIARYRKELKLTQEELGKMLDVTFQAVSKWETGQAMPDITLLPRLAEILRISVDKLLGYRAFDPPVSFIDEIYGREEYFGGVDPSPECLQVISLMPPSKRLKLLEIACGEGRDAVFFARCGYEVSATDLSVNGIEKTKRLAEKARVPVNAFRSDIFDYRLDCKYDIIYSRGVFHFIKPELRGEIIEDYRKHTNAGGLNAFTVGVAKPFTAPVPDIGIPSYPWRSGELLMYYHDWRVEDFSEYIDEKRSESGHAFNRLFARKPL
jgi:tellurite methyltransferase